MTETVRDLFRKVVIPGEQSAATRGKGIQSKQHPRFIRETSWLVFRRLILDPLPSLRFAALAGDDK
jgi:hypothetical protein